MSLGNNAIKFKLFELIYFLNVHHIILKHRYNLYAGLTGIVDYTNYDDVKYAVSILNLYHQIFLSVFFLLFLFYLHICRFLFLFYLSWILHGCNFDQHCWYSSITLCCIQIRKLDDSEFRNAFSRSYIRVSRYYIWLHSALYFTYLLFLTYLSGWSRWGNMIGVTPEVPVVIRGGAILEAAAHMYHEVEAAV